MLTDLDRKYIHEVALDNFVKDYVVEDIILFIEHSIADAIESSDPTDDKFKTINITNFGKFVVSNKKRLYAKRYYGKRDKDINGGETDISEGTSNSGTISSVDPV